MNVRVGVNVSVASPFSKPNSNDSNSNTHRNIKPQSDAELGAGHAFSQKSTKSSVSSLQAPGARRTVVTSGAPNPEACPTLVLNADYRPLSYYPLSLWSWQDAIKAVFMDRVHIVCEYDSYVRSPSMEMKLPSVVCLKDYVNHERKPAFTRFNVFLRDKFSCQYCGAKNDLTYDHIIPRSLNGKTTWENVITACAPCNLKKGGKLPSECNMHPAQKPVRPSMHMLHENGRAFPPNYLHASWMDFLYWDVELEP